MYAVCPSHTVVLLVLLRYVHHHTRHKYAAGAATPCAVGAHGERGRCERPPMSQGVR